MIANTSTASCPFINDPHDNDFFSKLARKKSL